MLKKIGFCFLCSLLLAAGSVFAQSENSLTSSDIQAYRNDFSRLCDFLEMQLKNSPHGYNLALAARKSMESLTDEDISHAFAKAGLPDLDDALAAVEKAVSMPPLKSLDLASSSAGFPNAPPVLSDCGDIPHDPAWRLGWLIAWQVAREALAYAEFVCGQVVVVLGEGGNTSTACTPLAIALAAAEIPVDLGEFCADEETAMKVEGNYLRLEHIHSDLETVLCEIVRLLNTPQGQRASDILSCEGQPGFPYSWPGKNN